MFNLVVGIAFVSSLAGSVFATLLALDKGRHPAEGLALGFFLGLVGLLIEAVLPTRAASPSGPPPTAEPSHAIRG